MPCTCHDLFVRYARASCMRTHLLLAALLLTAVKRSRSQSGARALPVPALLVTHFPAPFLPAAGALGNLAAHAASQSAISTARGLGRELVRALKECRGGPGTSVILAAIRNLAAMDKGRGELAAEPVTVPLLIKIVMTGAAEVAAR